ncbi:uncharacterized protein [Pyrus communis]|uniref:uncharacterized protein n=1 Tax=Pyrus communis TaxID=23211 RepID=UPI0035BF2443
MANLEKLEFAALDITEMNYLTWVLDTNIYLEARNLGDTIREESSSSSQDREKAMIFIRHHLDEALKSEYLTVEDLLALWNALRNIYNHQTTMILLKTRYEWTHLRIQDFKSMAEYDSALFKITSQTITDEHLLEKTFSTFHASNARPCTPKHLVDLYQASLKENGVETNFLDEAKPMDIPDPVFDLSVQLNTTHLDVSDFIVERGSEVYRSD